MEDKIADVLLAELRDLKATELRDLKTAINAHATASAAFQAATEEKLKNLDDIKSTLNKHTERVVQLEQDTRSFKQVWGFAVAFVSLFGKEIFGYFTKRS